MSELRDVMAYLCAKYPYKDELSKARLTKMVYLADWKSAITSSRQITNIEWRYNHYGPYVVDVFEQAINDPIFEVESTANLYGSPKQIIRLADESFDPDLSDSEKQILDFVIKRTKDKFWNDFIRLVYSTYPIVSREKNTNLNLVTLAEEYKSERSLLFSEKDMDPTSEDLVRWFFENYEDPANGVPYDGSEGGYQYVFGGPFDPREVLHEEFPNVNDETILHAAERIYGLGFEWVRKGDY